MTMKAKFSDIFSDLDCDDYLLDEIYTVHVNGQPTFKAFGSIDEILELLRRHTGYRPYDDDKIRVLGEQGITIQQWDKKIDGDIQHARIEANFRRIKKIGKFLNKITTSGAVFDDNY